MYADLLIFVAQDLFNIKCLFFFKLSNYSDRCHLYFYSTVQKS